MEIHRPGKPLRQVAIKEDVKEIHFLTLSLMDCPDPGTEPVSQRRTTEGQRTRPVWRLIKDGPQWNAIPSERTPLLDTEI